MNINTLENAYEYLYEKLNNELVSKNSLFVISNQYKIIVSYFLNHNFCYLDKNKYIIFRDHNIKFIANVIKLLTLKSMPDLKEYIKLHESLRLFIEHDKQIIDKTLFNLYDYIYNILKKTNTSKIDTINDITRIREEYVKTFTNTTILRYFTGSFCNALDITKCELLTNKFNNIVNNMIKQ